MYNKNKLVIFLLFVLFLTVHWDVSDRQALGRSLIGWRKLFEGCRRVIDGKELFAFCGKFSKR